MIVIGIIGGVASGKSVVTETLRSLGAFVLNVDQIGHQVLLDAEVKQQIRQRWGDAVFTADGEVNRSAVAAIVFDPEQPDELVALEQMTHPKIEARIRQQLQLARDGDTPEVLVLDAPIMVKTGWHRLCDVLLFVECSRQRRLQFATARGWSEAMFAAREANQVSIRNKQELATHTIRNDGSLEDLRQQVRQFRESLIPAKRDPTPVSVPKENIR